MRGSVVCMVMVLLLFALSHNAEVHGATGALQARFGASISKVRNAIKPAADKLLPLRKGMAGALLGTLIYVSGILPHAAAAPEVVQSSHEVIHNSRNAGIVTINQSEGKQLLMPVHKSSDGDTFVVNPAIVREFADFLAVFVDSTKSYEARDQVNRVLQYWHKHFAKRAAPLHVAVDAVREAKKRAGIEGDYIPSSKEGAVSEEIGKLEQQLAFLTLEELIASLNATLKVEDVTETRDRDLRGSIMHAYRNSGYIKVEIDTEGRATPDIHNELYNYYTPAPVNKVRLAYRTVDEATPFREMMMLSSRYNKRKFYDTIMERASVYGHLGVVSTLLVHGYNTDLDKYMLIASEIGHTEIAKAIIKRTKVNYQLNLNAAIREAASNGHTEIAIALLAAGADPNEGLVGAAVGGELELVKHCIELGATEINRALLDAVLFGDDSAFHIATYLSALGGIDLNAALKLAAVFAGQEGSFDDVKWIEHLIRLGADNFNEALLAFAEAATSVSALEGAELLIARASNLDLALSALMETEDAHVNGFMFRLEELARLLIRSGADIEDALITLGLYDGERENEVIALLRIFAEERS